MAVRYDGFYVQMKKQHRRSTEFIREAGISANILTKMSRNKYISLQSLEHICRELHCSADEIVTFYPDEGEK